MAETIQPTIEKISPEMAEQWLASNTHNRPLRNRQVEFLRGVIQRGEWFLNGDAIRFDETGTLIDGQHRLWAIALSETPVESLVIRGLKRAAQLTIDVGTRRNLADQLRMMGQSNPLNLAAALVGKWRYDNGLIRTSQRPTIQQALSLLEANPDLEESVKVHETLRRANLRVMAGAGGFLHYEFSSVDPDAAEDFYERLKTGTNLTKTSPVLHLRNRLLAGKTSAVVQSALFIKAWNAFVMGEEVKQLMWRPVGTGAEAFPVVVKP